MCLLLLGGCEVAEISPKEHPSVVMKHANVSEQGVKLIAETYAKSSHTDLYGVWKPDPEMKGNRFEAINARLTEGELSLFLDVGLQDNLTHFVRPYVETAEISIYGTELSFLSQEVNLRLSLISRPKVEPQAPWSK